MMQQISSLLALSGLVTMVAGHGFVLSPPPRQPGSALASSCGFQVQSQQSSDKYGNIQGILQVARSQQDFNPSTCDVWLCKGYKFEDNAANVQSFTAGQKIPMQVEIRAPHDGVANVSIVDTETNSVIGTPLISWDKYALTSTSVPDNQKNFEITMPSDLGSKCSTAGKCVIQWYWDARSVDQTYESCIDFTVAGSGSGSGSPAPVVSATRIASATRYTPSATRSAASSAAATPTSIAAVATSTAAVETTAAAATSAPAASATPTGSTPAPVQRPSKPLPAGFTAEDVLEWAEYYLRLGSQEGSASNLKLRSL